MARAAGVSSCLLLGTLVAPGASTAARGLIGMEVRVDLSLAGPELEAKPVDPKAPVQLRIAGAIPDAAGFRYDFRCIGLEPGRHDLRNYLEHRDGSTLSNLPPIEVQIEGTLLPIHNGLLLEAPPRTAPRVGGYGWAMGGAAVAWGAGLAWILIRGRRPATPSMEAAPPAPATLAERLRPVLGRIEDGTATSTDHAQLERMLLDHWQASLGIPGETPEAAVRRLREDPAAGPVLLALEQWLHHPEGKPPAHLAQLLASFRLPVTPRPGEAP